LQIAIFILQYAIHVKEFIGFIFSWLAGWPERSAVSSKESAAAGSAGDEGEFFTH
jgi:hypothetical protein